MTTLMQKATDLVDDDADQVDTIVVSMSSLLDWGHPLQDPPWGCEPISVQDVERVVRDGTTSDDHEHARRIEGQVGCWGCEVERIAWFVEHGVPRDDEHPITFDGGLAAYAPEWPIVDGNHRVAALVVRGAAEVEVALIGDVERARELLS